MLFFPSDWRCGMMDAVFWMFIGAMTLVEICLVALCIKLIRDNRKGGE